MYDMNRGELRYSKEHGYYYENDIDEISYIKVAIALSLSILIGLVIYKYDYITDIFQDNIVAEDNILEIEDVVQKKNSIIKDKVTVKTVTPQPIKSIERETVVVKEEKEILKEENITKLSSIEEDDEVVFFTSMGKTVDNSKIEESYKEPKN